MLNVVNKMANVPPEPSPRWLDELIMVTKIVPFHLYHSRQS